MRGTFLHNNVIAAALIKALHARGYQVYLEHPIRHGRQSPAVDIYFEANGRKTVIEIERTIARIPNDITKAKALSVDQLLIVTPNARVAHAAKSALNRLAGNAAFTTGPVHVMAFGAALQWITNNCPILSARNVKNDI